MLVEENEHVKNVKEEGEKRLAEAMTEKSKIESTMQAKLNELQQVKSESEKYQADQLSNVHVICIKIFELDLSC